MTIGEIIQKLRKASNMTQLQLAEKLIVTDKAVSKWETEGGTPEVPILNKIAELFKISLEYLVKGNAVTVGDKAAISLIENFEREETKKDSNLETIKTCKRILKENGIEPNEGYLPKLKSDKTTFEHTGVFSKKDLTVFDFKTLLYKGLTDVVLEKFSEQITFNNAVLCDDIRIYQKAMQNCRRAEDVFSQHHSAVRAAGNHLGDESYICRLAQQKSGIDLKNYGRLNTALEKLNPNLPRYYEVVIFLIDNGATYLKDKYEIYVEDLKKEVFPDRARTNFVYRVAKDMVALMSK